MTTQELHIELDLLLQKIDSNWSKNLLPQEKDWFINSEILKFLKQRTSNQSNRKQTGSFNTTKRTQDINSLIRTELLNVIYNQEEAIVQLPLNYLAYISSNATICCTCDNEEQEQGINYESKFATLEGVNSLESSSNYKIQIVIGGVAYTIFDLSTLPDNYIGQGNINQYKKQFILINGILIKFREANIPNVELKYDKLIKKFIVRTKQPHTILITLNNSIMNIVSTSIPFNTYSFTDGLKSPIRIIDEEFKDEVNNSYLSKSKDESLLAYLRADKLILEIPDGVILNSVKLSYFCVPQRVDLLLNSNSDLSDSNLKEIIANTTQVLKAVIGSDTYEKYAQENILIE